MFMNCNAANRIIYLSGLFESSLRQKEVGNIKTFLNNVSLTIAQHQAREKKLNKIAKQISSLMAQ